MNKQKHSENNRNKSIRELPDYGIWAQSRVKRPSFGETGHSHDYPSIIYVVAGKGQLIFDEKSFDLSPNTVIPLQKKTTHELLDQDQPMTVFSLYFDENNIEQSLYNQLFSNCEPFQLPLYYAEKIKQNLRQILHEQSHNLPGYKLSIQQFMNLILLQLYRARLKHDKTTITQKNSTERVQQTLDYITENCHEQYTLSDAAKMASLSQRQFTNICRKLTEESFIQFLNSYRCKRAKELLTNTDLPISAIAFEIGFEELSSFYRAFKKHYQTAPSEFRS